MSCSAAELLAMILLSRTMRSVNLYRLSKLGSNSRSLSKSSRRCRSRSRLRLYSGIMSFTVTAAPPFRQNKKPTARTPHGMSRGRLWAPRPLALTVKADDGLALAIFAPKWETPQHSLSRHDHNTSWPATSRAHDFHLLFMIIHSFSAPVYPFGVVSPASCHML